MGNLGLEKLPFQLLKYLFFYFYFFVCEQRLGGDWFVFQCELNNTDFDFYYTKVKGGD